MPPWPSVSSSLYLPAMTDPTPSPGAVVRRGFGQAGTGGACLARRDGGGFGRIRRPMGRRLQKAADLRMGGEKTFYPSPQVDCRRRKRRRDKQRVLRRVPFSRAAKKMASAGDCSVMAKISEDAMAVLLQCGKTESNPLIERGEFP